MVLLNDWSARDIQKWEYVPLGTILAKILLIYFTLDQTMDALEPFRNRKDQNKNLPTSLLNKRKTFF
jgi:fumarylacetoacetase